MTYRGFYTTTDLKQRYKISARTLNRWINRNVNPFPKPTLPGTGSLNRWSFEAVDEWEMTEAKSHLQSA